MLTAYQLQQAGVDHRLIEANKLFSGVSQNTTAKITAQHGLIYHKLLNTYGKDAALQYYKANREALERYRQLSRHLDFDFEEKDNFVYSTDEALLEQELRALQDLQIPAAFEAQLPLPVHTAGAVKFQNQAQMHPKKLAAAIAKSLPIHENTKAISFDGHCVVTQHGKIYAEKIIVATHFPIWNKHGSYFLKLYQERSYVLALNGCPDPGGMYVSADANGVSFRSYAGQLLIGTNGHRTGQRSRGWNDLKRFARQHYPRSTMTHGWAAQDCISLDGIPYIGRYSKQTPNMYVATGFNKWGMTSAMTAATVLTDLVMEKENPYAPLFSPCRSIWHKQLFTNARESIFNLATFRTPRCPHMGCAMKWNKYERSWDCPCHGSRFSEAGNLLDGPATADLSKKQEKA